LTQPAWQSICFPSFLHGKLLESVYREGMRESALPSVIPAQAGIHLLNYCSKYTTLLLSMSLNFWIPVFTGMTEWKIYVIASRKATKQSRKKYSVFNCIYNE
jgi:hypothetical protein